MFEAFQIEERRQVEQSLVIFKAGARAFREILIGVLGLRFKSQPKTMNITDLKDDYHVQKDPDDDVRAFTPLSHLVGRPEALNAALEASELTDLFEESIKAPLPEESDMEPILSAFDQMDFSSVVSDDEMARMREALGIQIRVEDPNAPPPAIITAKPRSLK